VAGVVASIRVADVTPTPTAFTPSMVTVAPLTKFAPMMVTRVPPTEGPITGEMELTDGGDAYTNAPTSAPRCPSGLIASTSTTPGGCGGATPVTRVGPATDGMSSGFPPMLIVTPVANPVPVIATVVCPVTGDALGVMSVTAGPATYVYPPASVAVGGCPCGFVTTTSTAPAACAGVSPVSVVGLTNDTLVAAVPPKVMVAPG